MKKVILFIVIVLSLVACKKNAKTSAAPATDVYCIWVYNSNIKVFYECVEDETKMQSEMLRLRNENKFPEAVVKATCSDC